MQLTYTPDFAQLFEANAALAQRRYSFAQKATVNLILFGSMLAGGMLAAVGGTLIHIFLLPDVPEWIITIALFAIVALFYWRVLRPWQFNRSAAYVNATRKDGGPMHFSADETGMRWSDIDIDFRLNWSGVEAVYATKTSLCFMSGVIGLVLPLDAFDNAEASRVFINDVLARIAPEAAARSRADKSLNALL